MLDDLIHLALANAALIFGSFILLWAISMAMRDSSLVDIWFLNEVHVGEEVSLFLSFTARNDKRVQGHVFLLNVTHERLASVVEFVSAAADLDARRTVPLPAVIAGRIDELMARERTLDWTAPPSGAISI